MCGVMQIESLCMRLQDAWQDLQDKAQDRSHKLDLSLKAQQFFFEAGEVESWLSEKIDVLSSTDYGGDHDAASKLLTNHKVCCACSALNCVVLLLITWFNECCFLADKCCNGYFN